MTEKFDIAVIGGGVVGLAILRRFAMAGVKALLLERGADILSGASKGNSALLHTGFDAPPGTLELQCIKSGYAEYMAIRAPLNLPLIKSSALVVAWTQGEEAALDGIVEKAHANGIADVQMLDVGELRIREPRLAADARKAVLVPGESVVDPWSAPLAYAHQAIAYGARIERRSDVIGAAFDGKSWTLQTAERSYNAGLVINAAGLRGDLVEQFARPSPFTIMPRKGQFVVFDKTASKLVSAIILPVPTERTKGVVLFPTVFGNLAIGPTAEDQEDRERAPTDGATLSRLIERAQEMVPDLASFAVTATYAGLRPATQAKDYVIECLPARRWITAGGIRSTGLSAALGIAGYVAELYEQNFGSIPVSRDPVWTPVPNLAEATARPYEEGGEIVCHCELVTRREIEAALVGALPATDLGGLKRRTRATMGRCQGFYCMAQVMALLAGARQ